MASSGSSASGSGSSATSSGSVGSTGTGSGGAAGLRMRSGVARQPAAAAVGLVSGVVSPPRTQTRRRPAAAGPRVVRPPRAMRVSRAFVCDPTSALARVTPTPCTWGAARAKRGCSTSLSSAVKTAPTAEQTPARPTSIAPSLLAAAMPPTIRARVPSCPKVAL
jgi:hypothetical protein